MNAVIQFTPEGIARAVYTEEFPLQELGTLTATRASTVEHNATTQQWEVRLATEPDTIAYSHASRSECIRWEVAHLNAELASD